MSTFHLNRILLVGLLMTSLTVAAAPVTPNYRIVNTTEYGRAAMTDRSDANTVTSALLLTVGDLTRYFGTKPAVRQAYDDAKDHRSGGATFTVSANGVALKGLITCRLNSTGATVGVIYIRTDAPAGEWEKLTSTSGPSKSAATGKGAASPGEAPQAATPAGMRTYNFPDGTGFIGLADGWSTQAQSCLHGAQLDGPHGENIVIGSSISGVIPNSSLAGMGGFVSPFGTPAQILGAIGPQISMMSQRQGGPAKVFDSIVQGKTLPAQVPGGLHTEVTLGVTETDRTGQSRHFKVASDIEVVAISATGWMLMINQVRAPDEFFQRDLPTMIAMAKSWRINVDVVNRMNGQASQAQNQWFANQQKAHQDQVAGYERQNQQWRQSQLANDQRNQNWHAQEKSSARHNDDFSEVIRGTRTVEDTRTGERHSVDLGNVDSIADSLNRDEAGRYRQIPLRDENNPQ